MRMRIRHVGIVAIVYLLMMLPPDLAGRGWLDIFTVYIVQIEVFPELAKGAPNPWKIVSALHLLGYKTGLFLGLSIAGSAALAIVVGALRLESSSRTILLVAAWSAALMPYLLPT